MVTLTNELCPVSLIRGHTEVEHRKPHGNRAHRNFIFVWLTWFGNSWGARNSIILLQTNPINHFSNLENTGRAISSPISSSRKLKFSEVDEVIFLPTPCDLSQEKYNFSSMVESRPIPKSHLSVVISSYEQTIGNFFINFCLQIRSNNILPIYLYICLLLFFICQTSVTVWRLVSRNIQPSSSWFRKSALDPKQATNWFIIVMVI